MSELTLQRNHMNIIYVVKPLVDALTLAIMKQHTPERNPRDIMNVEESSVSAPTFINSRELTEWRNPAAVSQHSSLTENSESSRKGSSKSLPGGESHLETTR